MDYKSLLEKYIQYVVDCEGIDYLGVYEKRYCSDVKFSEAEWTELNRYSNDPDEEVTDQ